MPITEQQLRDRFPNSFPASFPSAVLTDALAEAELRIDRIVLGDLADRAQLWLSAYLAKREQAALGEGIASATAGPVSVTYRQAIESEASAFYTEYQRIIRLTTFGVTVSGWVG
jgi:hypothetical protein